MTVNARKIPLEWRKRVLGALQKGPPGTLRAADHPQVLVEEHRFVPRPDATMIVVARCRSQR